MISNPRRKPASQWPLLPALCALLLFPALAAGEYGADARLPCELAQLSPVAELASAAGQQSPAAGNRAAAQAHGGMRDAHAICASCHAAIVECHAGSLHATLGGMAHALRLRSGEDDFARLEPMWKADCATCHASCSDCHRWRAVSRAGIRPGIRSPFQLNNYRRIRS